VRGFSQFIANPKEKFTHDTVFACARCGHSAYRRRNQFLQSRPIAESSSAFSAMLIHESRILQVTIFGTLHKNLSALNVKLLLPDVMTIADEVDSQLTQTNGNLHRCTAFIGEGAPCETEGLSSVEHARFAKQ
jgi:hypothetical protein